jgi:phenylpropionate dioxygenase-like ring-hydroxylating dioxygenase large terminal subunit
MFLRNSWYVGASDHEIGRQPLRRVLLGEPIVFFRTEDGAPVAFEDRCAHRHLPLSMGKLIGDTLQCHYHGLRYDRTGACVRVPGQDMIPPSARVRTYPVVQRYHWVWVWMGDPALADPDRITDFHWLDDPNWGAKGQYLHVRANWQLIVDNLLDLTHLAFVHETTIGNSALVEHASVKVQRSQDNVLVTRWIIDQPAPPTFVKVGGFTGNVDRWQIIDFAPPAFLRLDVGATRRRHLHAQPQRHHAGDGNHQPLFLGAGARLRRPQSPDDRQGHRADPHGVPRGRRRVRGAAGQPGSDPQPAADRHQCRYRRDPGAPHSRAAPYGRAGRRGGDPGGGRITPGAGSMP